MKETRRPIPTTGSHEMDEKKLSNDAVEWAYNRYIKGDPEQEAYFDELGIQVGIARQIYDIRERLRMTREDLAEFSGLSVETIKEMEETNYDGDWDEAIEKINGAFAAWVTKVLAPSYKVGPPKDYRVQPKAVHA